ncbi:histone-lysine N-methyltransferase SMYD3 [Schistocerca nitens]|uniref:histone-lysine N-methyltransferase SMYD3 n=1 Tax=Schistocerca nitens TaxID=7011 RepID=UPI00211768DD|nr:histone-lysine N-methyltransferase SMYD3 [Schistocerca nitens]
MLRNMFPNNVEYSMTQKSGKDCLREIRSGSVLLIEKPFAFVLKSSLRAERCAFCLKTGKLSRCSGCQFCYYCGRECQKSAWLDHKYECHLLKKISPRVVPDAAMLVARIIFKLQRGADQEMGFYSDNTYRKFRDLMSHYPDIKKDDQRMQHFASICGVLLDYIGAANLPNHAELMGIYGRMCINGFSILDPEMHGVGTGIYLGASVIDHSCCPNAVAVFDGTKIYIRAVEDIPSPDWNKVFIAYIDTLNYATDRQAELQQTYYFTCSCLKCKDIEEACLMDSMLCPNSKCGAPVSHTYGIKSKCPECGTDISQELIDEYQNASSFTERHLNDMKEYCYLDICISCLKKQEGLFHPYNLQHVKTLDMAFETAIQMGLFTQARKYGEELIPGLRKYYGERHPLLGISLMKCGKICVYLGDFSAARDKLEEAEHVIKLTHGVNHILYKSELEPLLLTCHVELKS